MSSSTIKVLGIDLGKSKFHLIGLNAQGQPILKKQFPRTRLVEFLGQLSVCTVAFESCGGSHWLGRYCQSLGHTVKLIPPQYVKPFVKGNKTDFNDALAIAEASQSATMRFAQIKSEQAQCLAAIHRIREGFVIECTAFFMHSCIVIRVRFKPLLKVSLTKSSFNWLGEQNLCAYLNLLYGPEVAYQHLSERIIELALIA